MVSLDSLCHSEAAAPESVSLKINDMAVFAAEGNKIFKIELSDAATVTVHATLPCAVIGTPGFVGEDLYYVDERDSSVNVIRKSGAVESVALLPLRPSQFLAFKNKLYALGGTKLVGVDPLNGAIEIHELHHAMSDFAAADAGFILLSEDRKQVWAFRFESGVATNSCYAVETESLAIVGTTRRRVVLRNLNSGSLLGVEDDGTVFSADALEGKTPIRVGCGRFVTSMEKLVQVHEGTIIVNGNDVVTTPSLPIDVPVRLIEVATTEAQEACTICYCEFETGDDGVTLDCGHRIHGGCLNECTKRAEKYLSEGEHVVFSMAKCPSGCGTFVRHELAPRSHAILTKFRFIQQDAVKQLKFEPPNRTVDDLLYYVCHKCDTPFLGGRKVCPRMAPKEPSKCPEDLICEACATDFRCPAHGREFVVFKCTFCCNVATNRCFGNRFVCDSCDAKWEKGPEHEVTACPGAELCPLQGKHPTEGTNVIGCALCLPPGTIVR